MQPHSGAQANLAVYFALLKPGRHRHGHGPGRGRPPDPRLPCEYVRQNTINFVSYGVTTEDGRIDYDDLAKQLAMESAPQADRGRCLAPIPAPSTLRSSGEIADELRAPC